MNRGLKCISYLGRRPRHAGERPPSRYFHICKAHSFQPRAYLLHITLTRTKALCELFRREPFVIRRTRLILLRGEQLFQSRLLRIGHFKVDDYPR